MRRCTNTEPRAVATGYSVDYEPRCFVRILAHWTDCVAQVGSGRYRSRFRICRPTLANSLLTWQCALKGLCSASWSRSLPVPYSSTHAARLVCLRPHLEVINRSLHMLNYEP